MKSQAVRTFSLSSTTHGAAGESGLQGACYLVPNYTSTTTHLHTLTFRKNREDLTCYLTEYDNPKLDALCQGQ